MKKFLSLIIALLLVVAASAQNRKALRINEVMVLNEESVVDDYGRHSAWIELFNSNFGPLQISKVYITNDSTNPTMYAIPLGDVNTLIPKRQHVIFWADGEPDKGTFHTNFTLTPGQDNYIAIYDADGKTLIDSVVIPADLQADQSYARTNDGIGEWVIRKGSQNEDFDYITPSSANIINDGNDKIDFFNREDENGFGLTIIAMGIVFCALLILCLCFYVISRIGALAIHRNKLKSHGDDTSNIKPRKDRVMDSGEEIAAIVMALHEHLNVHDRESATLTINKVKKAYSPWNSKIYNMRQLPELKAPRRR